jgi:hypothetical protein
MAMSRFDPIHLIIVGGVLLLAGAVLPFLIVMKVLPSTYFLNFFSYIAQIIGLFLGMYGAFTYLKIHRKKK